MVLLFAEWIPTTGELLLFHRAAVNSFNRAFNCANCTVSACNSFCSDCRRSFTSGSAC